MGLLSKKKKRRDEEEEEDEEQEEEEQEEEEDEEDEEEDSDDEEDNEEEEDEDSEDEDGDEEDSDDEDDEDDEEEDGEDEEEESSSGERLSFSKGMDAFAKALKSQKAQSQTILGEYVPTVWLRDGESALIRFLDDEPVGLFEHSLRVQGRWRSYTCRNVKAKKKKGVCPLCDEGFGRSLRAVYNVIDRRKWKDKRGKVHRNEVKLFKVNTRLFPQIRKIAEKKGLTNQDITIERQGEGTNTMYSALPEEKSRLSLEDRQKKRIDIVKALYPLEKKQMKSLLAEAQPSGKDSDDGWGDD